MRDYFIDNKDGTVTDIRTGLMWQQESSPTICIFKDAETYCKELILAGYSDWRLPTREELKDLAEPMHYWIDHIAIDTQYFPDTKPKFYWSSSPFGDLGSGVEFEWGDPYSRYLSDKGNVRAVRGRKYDIIIKEDKIKEDYDC